MGKTKNEVELEIRVMALEDLVTDLYSALEDYRPFHLTTLHEFKMKRYTEMKTKYPELKIAFPQ